MDDSVDAFVDAFVPLSVEDAVRYADWNDRLVSSDQSFSSLVVLES